MDCVKIESGTSLLRVFHAAPQAPAVDVYINEKLVFSNLQFTQFSSYVKLKEGEYRIDIFQTGTMLPIHQADLPHLPDSHHLPSRHPHFDLKSVSYTHLNEGEDA